MVKNIVLVDPDHTRVALREKQMLRTTLTAVALSAALSDHRVIGTDAPLRPVLLRREPAPSEMPLHRFVPAAILKADDIIRADRLVDWHRRRKLFVRLSRH